MKLGKSPQAALLAGAREVTEGQRDRFFASVADYLQSRVGRYRGRWPTEHDAEDAIRAAQSELGR